MNSGYSRPARRLFSCVLVRTLLLAGAVLLAGAGCSRGGGGAAQGQGEDGTGDRRFPLSGEVVSVDVKGRTVLVKHREVPGFMPAMTMSFGVEGGDAAALHEGERIRAELVVPKTGDPRLEKIWPDDTIAVQTVEAGGRALREDTLNRGSTPYREVGEESPDFALYNQDGSVVVASRFRGSQVMLNFIYTRCPIANMCPLSTTKMIQTQRLARAAGVTNVQFLSISLDPENDTPGVLKEYARTRGVDTSNFSLLTGPESAIKDLLAQFGVLAEWDGNLLKHTLATLLVDERGRIVWRAEGAEWTPKEFVDRMHTRPAAGGGA